MKLNVKTKYVAIFTLLLILVVVGSFGGGYWLGTRPLPTDPSDENPMVIKPISPITPGQQFSLTASDLKYYDQKLSFIMTATAPGKAKVLINRPKAWQIPDKMWIIGFGGGYYCGYWMPGATLGHLWKIGGVRKFNFYLGPELAVSAYNKINNSIPVAVSIYAKVLITY